MGCGRDRRRPCSMLSVSGVETLCGAQSIRRSEGREGSVHMIRSASMLHVAR